MKPLPYLWNPSARFLRPRFHNFDFNGVGQWRDRKDGRLKYRHVSGLRSITHRTWPPTNEPVHTRVVAPGHPHPPLSIMICLSAPSALASRSFRGFLSRIRATPISRLHTLRRNALRSSLMLTQNIVSTFARIVTSVYFYALSLIFEDI